MTPVSTIEGKAYPFGLKNIDTDVIIPAHWLKTITRAGLGRGAFESIRKEPGNLFDNADYAGSPILIAGDNFGCGSSREHAAWAMARPRYLGGYCTQLFRYISRAMRSKTAYAGRLCCPRPRLTGCWKLPKTDPIHIDLETQTVTTPFQDRFRIRDRPFSQALPAERCRRDRLDAGKQGDAISAAMRRRSGLLAGADHHRNSMSC
jgi:3-isopropylmalate/(R)-2-methylmalate dehydratase small subunit